MKKVLRVEPAQFAEIRRGILEDEIQGIDPGAYWARLYPGATEIQFVVVDPCICPCRGRWADESVRERIAAICNCKCHSQGEGQ